METMTRAMMAKQGIPCPDCGGPPLHPGVCIDQDGYVLPAYAELAELWEEQGRPLFTEDDFEDLEELLNALDEERRAT
jgi:hypothetical protein